MTQFNLPKMEHFNLSNTTNFNLPKIEVFQYPRTTLFNLPKMAHFNLPKMTHFNLPKRVQVNLPKLKHCSNSHEFPKKIFWNKQHVIEIALRPGFSPVNLLHTFRAPKTFS